MSRGRSTEEIVDDDPLITRRRVIRWLLVLVTGTLAILACWQDPVEARTVSALDGVRVTMHTDGHGAVWVNATRADGTPITDDIAATLTARERSGSTVLPTALTDLRDGHGSARYTGTLRDGVWTVTVDIARPGPGTCTAILTAAATAAPESVTCDGVIPTTATRLAAAESTPNAGQSATMAVLIGAAVVGVLFTAVTLATMRRRGTS